MYRQPSWMSPMGIISTHFHERQKSISTLWENSFVKTTCRKKKERSSQVIEKGQWAQKQPVCCLSISCFLFSSSSFLSLSPTMMTPILRLLSITCESRHVFVSLFPTPLREWRYTRRTVSRYSLLTPLLSRNVLTCCWHATGNQWHMSVCLSRRFLLSFCAQVNRVARCHVPIFPSRPTAVVWWSVFRKIHKPFFTPITCNNIDFSESGKFPFCHCFLSRSGHPIHCYSP